MSFFNTRSPFMAYQPQAPLRDSTNYTFSYPSAVFTEDVSSHQTAHGNCGQRLKPDGPRYNDYNDSYTSYYPFASSYTKPSQILPGPDGVAYNYRQHPQTSYEQRQTYSYPNYYIPATRVFGTLSEWRAACRAEHAYEEEEEWCPVITAAFGIPPYLEESRYSASSRVGSLPTGCSQSPPATEAYLPQTRQNPTQASQYNHARAERLLFEGLEYRLPIEKADLTGLYEEATLCLAVEMAQSVLDTCLDSDFDKYSVDVTSNGHDSTNSSVLVNGVATPKSDGKDSVSLVESDKIASDSTSSPDGLGFSDAIFNRVSELASLHVSERPRWPPEAPSPSLLPPPYFSEDPSGVERDRQGRRAEAPWPPKAPSPSLLPPPSFPEPFTQPLPAKDSIHDGRQSSVYVPKPLRYTDVVAFLMLLQWSED